MFVTEKRNGGKDRKFQTVLEEEGLYIQYPSIL